jgi:L-aspartate oxidase
MISTGDGLAIAYRAGAEVMDMEFIQFHPTTLYSPGAPQFLLSEAMRGEGAVLKNVQGQRFMHLYHEMAELAPRDAVTRAIVSEMVKTSSKHVFLDLMHLEKDFIKKRFPLIYTTCLQYDIDITEEMVPICPAAHYIMGGIKTNIHGETSIKGLFAAGEVACTGIHGANRLASNSLLEGLVYGARTGKRAVEYAAEIKGHPEAKVTGIDNNVAAPDFDIDKKRSSLRQIMWNKVGIIRCDKSLTSARNWLSRQKHLIDAYFSDRRGFEFKNMLTVACIIAESAYSRKNSVGAHYRSDFKGKGEGWQEHTVCLKDSPVAWVE